MLKNIDDQSIKSFGHFEKKKPYCTALFIFVFNLYFIVCFLFKIKGFDQLWTAIHQKIMIASKKLVFFKMPQHFLLVYRPKLLLFLTVLTSSSASNSPSVSQFYNVSGLWFR
jgi:hypothetical protein